MSFKVEKFNDIEVLTVTSPRGTVNEAEGLKAELTNRIEAGVNKFIVDLSDCEFIDSSFLGALVVNLKKSTANGGDLKLCGLQSAVNSMFQLTRMNRAFSIYQNKKEALESYKQ